MIVILNKILPKLITLGRKHLLPRRMLETITSAPERDVESDLFFDPLWERSKHRRAALQRDDDYRHRKLSMRVSL